MKRYEAELFRFIENRHPEVFQLITEKKQLADDVKAVLDKALEEFKTEFTV